MAVGCSINSRPAPSGRVMKQVGVKSCADFTTTLLPVHVLSVWISELEGLRADQ